jgi:hypothetical protein
MACGITVSLSLDSPQVPRLHDGEQSQGSLSTESQFKGVA